MKERPISYSPEMVRARREGRKKQTRRCVKPLFQEATSVSVSQKGKNWEKERYWFAEFMKADGDTGFADMLGGVKCPYGIPGDILWVRESIINVNGKAHYEADNEPCGIDWRWKVNKLSSRYMPKEVCRSRDKIVSVRVERVNEISEADARAEGPAPNWAGCDYSEWCPDEHGYLDNNGLSDEDLCYYYCDGKTAFQDLWDSINGKKEGRDWKSNPWVWVVKFEEIK